MTAAELRDGLEGKNGIVQHFVRLPRALYHKIDPSFFNTEKDKLGYLIPHIMLRIIHFYCTEMLECLLLLPTLSLLPSLEDQTICLLLIRGISGGARPYLTIIVAECNVSGH